jgi:short-subunit dehydrogenase
LNLSLNSPELLQIKHTGGLDFRQPTSVLTQFEGILNDQVYDLIIISVGSVPVINPMIENLININFTCPAIILDLIYKSSQNHECQVVLISSALVSLRPRNSSFVYTASKIGLDFLALGYQSTKSKKRSLLVVRPGFIYTKLTSMNRPGPFPQHPASLAKIVVQKLGRSEVLFFPKFLHPLIFLLNLLPKRIYAKLG